ncbi:hypothetical protein Bbelb_346470 [Branchiostoma belcheri]|nr:hypothetical protein Bbelb_346470 [Branchiostoma belcheri]
MRRKVSVACPMAMSGWHQCAQRGTAGDRSTVRRGGCKDRLGALPGAMGASWGLWRLPWAGAGLCAVRCERCGGGPANVDLPVDSRRMKARLRRPGERERAGPSAGHAHRRLLRDDVRGAQQRPESRRLSSNERALHSQQDHTRSRRVCMLDLGVKVDNCAKKPDLFIVYHDRATRCRQDGLLATAHLSPASREWTVRSPFNPAEVFHPLKPRCSARCFPAKPKPQLCLVTGKWQVRASTREIPGRFLQCNVNDMYWVHMTQC